MPTQKAAFKSLRQSKKRRSRNLKVINNLKSLKKKTRKAIEAGQKDNAKEFLAKTIKALDKAAQHRKMKKNTVARLKSRLIKKYNTLK
ncbi:MAG: 30S ribosomal protein S20 [Candidatus Kerfeldbacteria bacterium CG08_land_8_20_14_0_20_40_16]|uniref:Small ribosomal subunit protein bS20 n=1 Tax=Candidatus Kerfeldbacteria bacterium CG08_land_8_20_14_0_20_40_16 TaxID=2014244 RepID=A0A2H0YZD8_9BACT|nr:MAG: 30S ribosomal protein S20 [Candidatus Kerfeldbacteria bacterium CG08_land_8_20_14_0_20_40_16]